MDLGELVVNLTADAGGLNAGLNSASRDIDTWASKTNDSVVGFGNKMNGALAGVATVGVLGLTAGLTAVGGGIGFVTNQAADFEQRMSNLQAVSLASKEEMQALTETAIKLGGTTSFAANDVADAMYYLSSAGFSVEQNIGTIPSVLDLAAASGADLATTANILANTLSGFGVGAESASHYADVLALASAKSNTDVVMLGEGMKYVAPVAANLGFTIEETVAAMGKLSDAGIASGQAGTALRGILSNLASPVGRTADAVEMLGLNFQDADGTMKSMSGIIAEITEKTAGLTDVEKANYAQMLAGTEGMSALLVLMNEGEASISDYADELENANGTAKTMAETQLDNLKGSFEGMSGAIDSAVLTLGQAFIPIIRKGIDTITEFVSNTLQPMIVAFADKFPAALDRTNKLINHFISFLSSGDISDVNTDIAMLAEMFGMSTTEADNFAIKVTTVIEQVMNFGIQIADFVTNHAEEFKGALIGIGVAITSMMVIAAVSGAIATLVNPVTLIIGLAALLGAAWTGNWGGIQEKTQMVIDMLTPYIEQFTNYISGLWTQNSDSVTGTVSALWQFIQDAWNLGFPVLVDNADRWLFALKQGWIFFTEELPIIVTNLWTNIVNGFNAFVAMYQPFIDAFHNAQNGNWYAFGENLRTITDTMWVNITNLWDTFKTNATKVIETLWESIKSIFTKKGDEVKTNTQNTVDNIYKVFTETDWLKVGENVMKLIADGIRSKISSIVAAAQAAAQAALDAINGFFGNGQASTPVSNDPNTGSGVTIGTDSYNGNSFSMPESSKIKSTGTKNSITQINMPVQIHTANTELDFYTIFENVKRQMQESEL